MSGRPLPSVGGLGWQQTAVERDTIASLAAQYAPEISVSVEIDPEHGDYAYTLRAGRSVEYYVSCPDACEAVRAYGGSL